MRIAALVAASLLVAGCSHGSSQPGQKQTTTQASSGASSTTPPSTSPSVSKPQGPTTPPAAGAAIADVIAWIEAGHPADPGLYHSATREDVTTPLGIDIALTAQDGKVSCMTDSKHSGSALACLVSLTSPPPQPETAYGAWQGGWVDFDGVTLQVGSAHADPGPFLNGNGPKLADGDSLAFNEYRCRADQTGLFCVNYSHQSAARFSAEGILAFGCLRSVPPPDGVG